MSVPNGEQRYGLDKKFYKVLKQFMKDNKLDDSDMFWLLSSQLAAFGFNKLSEAMNKKKVDR